MVNVSRGRLELVAFAMYNATDVIYEQNATTLFGYFLTLTFSYTSIQRFLHAVPGCKVSVYNPLLSKILHPLSNLNTHVC